MARGFFITGTDTDVGKTTCALGLMRAFKEQGFTVAAMKPVSAGCEHTPQGLRNDDALRLLEEASVEIPYEIVNPYAFEPPIAPHIAAVEAGVEINLSTIEQAYHQIAEMADIVIVEGAGGWLVPISNSETMADVAKVLELEVITVVGIRLGCLNHALLTAESICSNDLKHTGWIANHLSKNMLNSDENIQTLISFFPSIFLGEIPFNQNLSRKDIAQALKNFSDLK